MNARILPIIAVATLVSLSSGCGCMRNFLFGNGARCGACNQTVSPSSNPQFGNSMQAPCGSAPSGQPGGCQQGCGTAQPGYSCGSAGTGYTGDCGCGNYSDPYMQGTVQGGMVPGSVGVPTMSPMSPGMSGPTMAPIETDDFSARRFDSQGNRIIWEEPHYGGTAL